MSPVLYGGSITRFNTRQAPSRLLRVKPPPDFAARPISLAQRSGASFGDNFNDNSIAAFWTVNDRDGSHVREVNQRLEIGPLGYLPYDSLQTTGIDLTDRVVYFRMPVGVSNQFTGPRSLEGNFYLRHAGDESYRIGTMWQGFGGSFYSLLQSTSNGDEGLWLFGITTTGQHQLHEWIRISHYQGYFVWESAPDDGGGSPGTWVIDRYQPVPPGFNVSNLDLVISGGYWNASEPTPGGLWVVDSINGGKSGPANVVTDIVGWWDASQLSGTAGSTVTSWADRSGSGRTLTPPSGMTGPTLSLAQINGLNTLLTGTGHGLGFSAASAFINNDDIEIFAVFQRLGYPGVDNSRLVSFDAGANDYDNASSAAAIYDNNNGQWQAYRNASLSAVSNSANADIIGSRWTGTQHIMRLNGIDATPIADTTGNFAATRLALSNGFGGGLAVYGYLAEVVVYNRALTTQERSDIEAYLTAKWSASDTTPPGTINVTSVSLSKISNIVTKNNSDVTFTADEAFVEYMIRKVPLATSDRTQGTLIEQATVSSTTSFTANITYTEATTGGAVEGTNLIKVFVKDAAGNWSS